ncbi:MAG: AAA family ATPase [Chthoniobacterales bacterium]
MGSEVSTGCAEDFPVQLTFSDTVYGRDSEIASLHAAFDRVLSDGVPEFVLVSGFSGIGKSTVVNEFRKYASSSAGFFASGKFDLQKGDIPYSTVTQAFHGLVHEILRKDDTQITVWRRRLMDALGTNGQLICNLLPELELILGKQPSVPELPPRDAQNRFKIIFRRFVAVFARPEDPLVLFLDDLQWVDPGTLKLLEDLLTEPEVKYLLLIGAYRANEVNSAHPLNLTLEKLRDTGVDVRDIPLAPLAFQDAAQFLVDSLRSKPDRAKPLTEILYAKTNGNPFFVIEFCKALAEENLLYFDPAISGWNWDLDTIRSRSFASNVAGLIREKLDNLTGETRQILKQWACLGSNATVPVVSTISGKSPLALDRALDEAIRAGLVTRQGQSMKFVHDRVQEAAYHLIPESDRVLEHLRIGRLLLENMSQQQIEDAIFDVVNQFNRGLDRLTSPVERTRLIELNLTAAKRAKAAAAYVSASNYLANCNSLLGNDGWNSQYEIRLAVNLNLAECELLTGQLNQAEERLSQLTALAKPDRDRAAIAELQAVLYTTSGRSPRAVQVCLECLQSIGIACPIDPTEEEVAREYRQIWPKLKQRPIEDLVNLPRMTDPVCKRALEMLTVILPASWFTDHNVRDLLIARMVNLSLEHGNSDASCYVYAVFARTLGSRFGDYENGYRFGKLSLELLNRYGSDRFKIRVYTCLGHHIDPWNRHMKYGREWLRLASAAAPEVGDLAFAVYNCASIVANLLASGEQLIASQKEAELALRIARKTGYGMVVDFINSQLAYIRALRGLTANLSSLDNPDFDESAAEERLDQEIELGAAKFRFWLRKLQACFHAGDYGGAVAAAKRVQHLAWRSQSFLELAEYPFYSALALAQLYPAAGVDTRIEYLNSIKAHGELLHGWARNCPENFRCLGALVSAEAARLEGRHSEAQSFYVESINSAKKNGFIQNEALANELAAKFYLARGLETVAHTYLRRARHCYQQWGAVAKVRLIDQQNPALALDRSGSLKFDAVSITSEAKRSLQPTELVANQTANLLDSATIVKALQAISSEIVLDKLIKTLMKIAVEHAGAQRGLLLLIRNNQPEIEAEAATINGRVEIVLSSAQRSRPAIAPGALGQKEDQSAESAILLGEAAPQSTLQYVIKTQSTVVLEDAAVRNPFSDDDYFLKTQAKSVLCVPIVRQTKTIGVFYLENNLTNNAFTQERITVLKLLASQAAISLENAHLYADLRKSEEKYRDLIEVSPDAIFVIDTDLNYVSVNSAGAQLAGCSAEELIGTPISETFVPEDHSLLPARMEMMKTEPYLRFERDFVRRNGEIVPVEVALTTIRGRYLQAVLRDISQRKRAEDALRASEQVARGQVEALTYSLDVLATASEPEKFLGKMLSTICRLLGGQTASLWLFDESADSLLLRLEVDSLRPVEIDRKHPLVHSPASWKEHPIVQELFFTAGPIVCDEIETDPRLDQQLREYLMLRETKKFLAVPILVGRDVKGMITVGHSERAPYRTEEIGLMQALAHQVMLAIRLTEVGEQSRQAAVLAERNRMARDVHDTLAQGFTGVIVQLEAAEYAISDGDRQEADRHIHQAGELARRSLIEARRSVHALRPRALEEDNFWQALKGVVKSTTVATTLGTTFELKGKLPVLPAAWQENLLRIGQETLSNTLKYARASNFTTRLVSNAKEVRLEFVDNGVGFQVCERHDGVGLTGMRERAEEMGGDLKIVSSLGKGTTITVILPLNHGRRNPGAATKRPSPIALDTKPEL